jgi:hypothetical protein
VVELVEFRRILYFRTLWNEGTKVVNKPYV